MTSVEFLNAYLKCAKSDNAIKGFEKSGIATCDPDVFTDEDFAPSEVIDNSEQYQNLIASSSNETTTTAEIPPPDATGPTTPPMNEYEPL